LSRKTFTQYALCVLVQAALVGWVKTKVNQVLMALLVAVVERLRT